MDIENPEAKRYLEEIISKTQGDTNIQVSMYEIGETLGITREEAGALAEDLIVQGWLELKTLSGGIGITSEGLEIIHGPATGNRTPVDGLRLGEGPVLKEDGRRAVERMLTDIRGAVVLNQNTFGQLEEIIVDIKTIETQMLSPNPKIEVIREVFRSLYNALKGLKVNDMADQVNTLIHT